MYSNRYWSSFFKLLIFISLNFGFIARADFQWSDNFTWNRARIIVPGQHSWSFRTSFQHSDSRFGASGNLQNQGQSFGRAWSWDEIIKGVSADSRPTINAYREQRGLQTNDIAATSTFQLQRDETMMELAWAYGLTTNWMIGIQIPISLLETKIQANTSMTPALSGALHGFGMAGAKPKSDQEVRADVQAAVNSRLAAEGYDQLRNRQQNVLVGDVSLMSQVALVQTPDWVFSLQQLVRIPSAPNNSVADYIRLSRDDGQIDLGLTAMCDHQWRRFLFGVKAGYVAQLPDVQKMRVPVAQANQNVLMVDRKVNRDLGDLVTTSFETFYTVNSRWGANVAYLGFFKSRDRYSGGDTGAAYWQMSDDSDQSMHLARGGVSYLIGKPSTRSGLQRKWVANVNVYQPIAGRNVTDGTTGAVELQAFF